MASAVIARRLWRKSTCHDLLRCAPLASSIRQRMASSAPGSSTEAAGQAAAAADKTAAASDAAPAADTAAAASDAAPPPAEAEESAQPDVPAYIRVQQERLAKVKVLEAEVTAGKRPAEFSGSGEIPTWFTVTAGLGALMGLSYWAYMYSRRVDSGEMKRFLEERAAEEGAVTRPSGLIYKVLKKGNGKYHPKLNSACLCHYKGTLIDGTEFDSSYGRGQPTKFTPEEVIKGWAEALKIMREGDKWQLYIPSRLAYGDSGQGDMIPPGAALVFEIELVKILGGKLRAKEEAVE